MTEGVRGYEFKSYFDKVPIVNRYFKLVCSLDEIPKLFQVREFAIVNLSRKIEPGSHWIVILRSGKQVFEVFNSLGFETLDILKPHLKFRYRTHVLFNEHKFQLDTSSTCGLFCIYFIVNRILCYDQCFDHVLQDIFMYDNDVNESKCIAFCSRLKDAADDSQLFEDTE